MLMQSQIRKIKKPIPERGPAIVINEVDSVEYIQVFYLNQLKVGIDDLVRISGSDFIDAVAFHVVPKLDVITVHEIQVYTVLAVLSYNHKSGVVPYVPGLFVKTEGVENFYGGYVFDHGNMCLLECKMYP
jgi:hypothetical protein